jgi:hypothetical protein
VTATRTASDLSDHRMVTRRAPPLGRRTAQSRRSPSREKGASRHQPWDCAANAGLWGRRMTRGGLGIAEDRGKVLGISSPFYTIVGGSSARPCLRCVWTPNKRWYFGMFEDSYAFLRKPDCRS